MTNTGYMIPESIKRRKSGLDDLMRVHEDISHGHVLSFVSSLSEEGGEAFGAALDAGKFDEAAEAIREHVVRGFVRQQISEIVKKKAGGGYVVYKTKDPRRDKGKPPQKAGETSNYATALDIQANSAKDQESKERYAKRAAKARGIKTHITPKPKKPGVKKSKRAGKSPVKTFQAEHLQMLRTVISHLVNERLFREETVGSEWEEYLTKISPKALDGDSKFKNLQKKIEKTTEGVLDDAFNAIRKAVGKAAKLKSNGIKKSDSGKTYLTFSAMLGDATVEPIYIYAENGIPHIEMSSEAENAITQAEPDIADMFRGKLASVQEKALSKNKGISDAVAARDSYLEKIEDNLDGYIASLTPLQMSLLKVLLVKKYRKV